MGQLDITFEWSGPVLDHVSHIPTYLVVASVKWPDCGHVCLAEAKVPAQNARDYSDHAAFVKAAESQIKERCLLDVAELLHCPTCGKEVTL